MKTFASALLASSVLGATSIIDFEMEGSYYMTRDPAAKFDVRALSLDNGSSDSTEASTSLTTGRYGALKYTYKLTTTLSGLGFNSVTTMVINNALKSTGAASNTAATGEKGWDMFTCFKNGGDATATLKQMTCWAMSAYDPTTATSTPNAKYDFTIYQYKTATAYNSTAH